MITLLVFFSVSVRFGLNAYSHFRGEGPGLGGGRLEPVVQNAWQKHVRSADQLPQETLAKRY